MQAKNITDDAMITAIHTAQARLARDQPYWASKDSTAVWAPLWYVEEAVSGAPPKVVLAKLRSMVKRGLILGCACGCRGDFRFED